MVLMVYRVLITCLHFTTALFFKNYLFAFSIITTNMD